MSNVRPDRTSILVQMTELRPGWGSRLQAAQGSDQWFNSLLWQPPQAEATILDTVENFRWLKDAGLSDQSALQHLAAHFGDDTKGDATLREYIEKRLKLVDPSYGTLADGILTRQLELADKWAQEDIRWTKSEAAFPPNEWLTARIGSDDIDSAEVGSNIMARLTGRDELWEFSSPADTWENLAGRAGVALIRDGRSIAHVITVMN